MIEAGPIVSAAFVNADLVDEAVVFRSPNAIGPDGIDALEGLPLAALTASPRLSMKGTEMAGADTVERLARQGVANVARSQASHATAIRTIIPTTMVTAMTTGMTIIMTTIMITTITTTTGPTGIPIALSTTGSRAMRAAWPSACRSSRR